jgi:hypothetical protein
MRWVADTPRRVAQLAERHVWLFAIASVVFWTLLSPLALVWLVLWLFARYRARGTSPAAKQERRVARLLRWYPVDWRTRYGDEMAALLHDTIADGRDGPLMAVNVAREGMATRLAPPERRQALAGACLGLCWLPLFPQGVVAAILKSVGTPTRSRFLALHAPDAFQWPLITAMVALGLAMLGTGITLARTPVVALPD